VSPESLEEVRRALDSVVWCANNLQNYGTEEWLTYFRAATDDVERARLVLTLAEGYS
jgi:hypothetical protein